MPNKDGVLSAEEYVQKRAPIAEQHGRIVAAIEKQYIEDKGELERAYVADLNQAKEDWPAAYVSAGLNPDGSDPGKQVPRPSSQSGPH